MVESDAHGTVPASEILAVDNPSGLCWFCESGTADPGAARKVGLHRDAERSPTGHDQYRLTWRSVTVPVPRCTRCGVVQDNHHRRVDRVKAVAAWSTAALVLAWIVTGTTVLRDSLGVNLAVFLCLIAVVQGVHVLLRVRLNQAWHATRPARANSHPVVERLKSDGWIPGAQPIEAG